MGQSLWISAGFNGSTSSCPHSRREIGRTKSGVSITLQQQKIFMTATDALGLNRVTMNYTRLSGASIDRMRGFRNLQEMQRRGQWKAFSSVTRYEADYHTLPRPLRYKLETLAQRAEVLLTMQLQVRRLTNALLERKCLTCSVDLAS